MKNDVFISYSTMDKHVADAICSTLENSGVRCWIAPRDIFPGSDWAQSISSAIKSSSLMVLVFSENSNGSSQVSKELNLAVSNKLMVLPFKIDDSTPSGNMEYFLADMHWLDAIGGDMQAEINKLRDVVISVLPHNMNDNSKQDKPVDETSGETQNKSNDVTAEKTEAYETKKCMHCGASIPKAAQFCSACGNRPEPLETEKTDDKENVFTSYMNMWKNYFNFKGRTSRRSFWQAYLVNFVVSLVLTAISQDLGAVYTLAVLIPGLAMGVRRLHDTNRSGHWLWLCLTVYGAIVPFIFYFFKGVDEKNRWAA